MRDRNEFGARYCVLALPVLMAALASAAFAGTALAQSSGETRGLGSLPPSSLSTSEMAPGTTLDNLLRSDETIERIINGKPAKQGEWPSMVKVAFLNQKRQLISHCGGTVIGREWVLTAGHCVEGKIDPASGWVGVIGEGSVDIRSKTMHIVRVAKIVLHESFLEDLKGAAKVQNDLALLQLAEPLTSPRQKLVGESAIPEVLVADHMGSVVGFGLTSNGGDVSNILREADLPIVAKPVCEARWGSQAMTDAVFCAGYKDGHKDSCQGDSGGPFYVTDKAGAKLQAGVVSYGPAKCATPENYAVYASVGHFETWLKAHVPDAEFAEKSGTDTPIDGLVPDPGPNPNPGALAQVTLDIPEGHKLRVGSYIQIRVTSSIAGQVVVYNDNPDGHSYQVYPSDIFPAPGPDRYAALIVGGKVLTIPSPQQRDQGYKFGVAPPFGINHLRAIVVPEGRNVADLIRQYADGREIPNLSSVLDRLVAAEAHDRGIIGIHGPATDKGSAEFEYEIVQ